MKNQRVVRSFLCSEIFFTFTAHRNRCEEAKYQDEFDNKDTRLTVDYVQSYWQWHWIIVFIFLLLTMTKFHSRLVLILITNFRWCSLWEFHYELNRNKTLKLRKHNGKALFENMLLSGILGFIGVVTNCIKGSNQSTWTISSGIITSMVQTAGSSRWYTNWWFIIDIRVSWWRTHHEEGKLRSFSNFRSLLLILFFTMKNLLSLFFFKCIR